MCVDVLDLEQWGPEFLDDDDPEFLGEKIAGDENQPGALQSICNDDKGLNQRP